MVGDSLTLICSVTLPAGVTGTPDFQWEGPGVTATSAAPTTSGQEVSSVLTLSAVVWMVGGVALDDTFPGHISADADTLSFSPLATSDTGNYTCDLNVTTQQTHVRVQTPQQSAVKKITVQSNV